VKIIRATYRLISLVATTLAFTLIGIALKLFFSKNTQKHNQYVTKFTQRWARCVCKFLNIEITLTNKIPSFNNALIVANHVGSPDIFVLGSCFQTYFISKEDVKHWPLIGFLAELGQTIFVNREKKQQVRKTILSIKNQLVAGFSVLLFPEARVTKGVDVFPFKSAHFEAAVLSNRPVLPVMIHYENSENQKIAQWGNQTFIFHLIALLKNKKLKASVTVFDPIMHSERKKLSNQSHTLIQNSYNKIINK
jgi:1-acyl-sn-glycerol-3-phosphate acyltransferase